ncbi:MAG: AAA family ATPase [Oscillospiraceae bacterium]|nr:AAA family ATPase [Oscillospiraceae bacterium]
MRHIPEGIAEITLPQTVFQTGICTPAAVNLICGKNGTGKSTFAEQLRHPEHLRFAAAHCEILHFDRRFIRNNIRQYANMPGVLIISRKSAELLALHEQIAEKRRQAERLLREQAPEREKLRAESEAQKQRFAESCRRRTQRIRAQFPAAMQPDQDMQRLADTLLFTMPRYCDISELRARYRRAFETEAQKYPEFRCIEKPHLLDHIEGAELLSEPVLSSRDSAFAQFMNRLHAADWVQQGHAHFSQQAEGICPYCQQKLPADFDAKLRACFDDVYQQSLRSLEQFRERYRQAANELYLPLQENLKTRLPDYDYSRYSDMLRYLRQIISANLERIGRKLENPSETIRLEPVTQHNDSINREIIRINKAIRQNNEIITESRRLRRESTAEILAYLAYQLRDESAAYQSAKAGLALRLEMLDEQCAALQAEQNALTEQLRQMTAQASDPDGAVRTMNKLLSAAGYAGFRLVRSSDRLTYTVLRENGQTAGALSEGEQRFLAFLYFYHLLLAGAADGTPRVAVIDDPFTALDRDAAGIVCRLLQKLLPQCGKTPSAPAQIFVLTCQEQYYRAMVHSAQQMDVQAECCIFRKTPDGTLIEPAQPAEKDVSLRDDFE